MIEYIIGVIHAIDILCNFSLGVLSVILFNRYNDNLHIKKLYIVLFVIALLGVIFIPSKETLEILLLN